MMTLAPLARTAGVSTGNAAARFAATNAVAEQFFAGNADAIARACQAMAKRFQDGGRLLVCGDAAQRSDVAHVVVEFVHPVVVGKRALPAIPLPEIAGGAAQRALAALAGSDDILMLMSSGGLTAESAKCLEMAAARGLLTLALVGMDGDAGTTAAHRFTVPSVDAGIVQETQEMLYHVLWELVHVFFEHRAVRA